MPYAAVPGYPKTVGNLTYLSSGYQSANGSGSSGVIQEIWIKDKRTNTGRFAQKLATGVMNPAYYAADHHTVSYVPGSASGYWRQWNGSGYTNVSTQSTGPFFTSPVQSVYAPGGTTATILRQRALATCLEQVRSQSISTIETLVEAKKTTEMCVNIVRDLAYAARDVRHGRFGRAASRLGLASVPKRASKKRKFSDNWLEYRYGWLPLYGTVYGALDHLWKQGRNPQGFILKASGYATQRVSRTNASSARGWGSPSASFDGGVGQSSLGWDVKDEESADYRTRCTVYYRIINETLINAQSLGLTNPALVAWELVPLSFVVDWFVNVSDVLGSIDAFVGKSYITGFYSEKVTAQRTLKAVTNGKSDPDASYRKTTSFSGAQCTVTSQYFKRDPLSTTPSVGISLNAHLNIKRYMDALALLRQMLR